MQKGYVKNLKIYGNFFGKESVHEVEDMIQGVRYEPEDIAASIEKVDIKDYFGNIEKDEFLDLIYGEDE